VVITALTHVNVAALIARALSRVQVPLIVTEHSAFSASHPYAERQSTARFLPPLMRWLYPKADFIVGVSQGVIDDLKKVLRSMLPSLGKGESRGQHSEWSSPTMT